MMGRTLLPVVHSTYTYAMVLEYVLVRYHWYHGRYVLEYVLEYQWYHIGTNGSTSISYWAPKYAPGVFCALLHTQSTATCIVF